MYCVLGWELGDGKESGRGCFMMVNVAVMDVVWVGLMMWIAWMGFVSARRRCSFSKGCLIDGDCCAWVLDTYDCGILCELA